VRAVPRL